jgi:putative heme transporter
MSVSRCERPTAYASPDVADVSMQQLAFDHASIEQLSVDLLATGHAVTETPAPASKAIGVWSTLRQHWQVPVIVIMLAVAYFTLQGRLPSVHSVANAISSASIGWIVVAILCEIASLSMFARQQRSLLGALDVRMSFPRALALTYARSALAISMPAGSAVSAGYAFQQYRRSGATTDKAAAVMVLSGIVSFLGLGALYVAGILGLIATGPAAAFRSHPALIYVVAGLVVLAFVTWMVRRRLSPAGTSAQPALAGPDAGRIDRIRASAASAIAAWRSLRGRDWAAAGAFAVANWLLDLLCLAAAARAFALPVGLFTIATMYLGVQVIRQLPITPGGIGLIETGLLAGLTHAGAAAGAATAVVLTYRVLSCWAIIPIGGLAWLGLRARPLQTKELEPTGQRR